MAGKLNKYLSYGIEMELRWIQTLYAAKSMLTLMAGTSVEHTSTARRWQNAAGD